MTQTARVLPVPGSLNLRDLGGLTGRDGRLVRTGQLFRSDYPTFAEQDDGAAVRSLGLRSVLDLRRGTEAAAQCPPWETLGVEYRRFPLVAKHADSWHARYSGYLTHRPETVVAAVRHVLDPAMRPVLFHCAAGKDRTGVVAALALLLLGVSEEDVVADYLISRAAVTGLMLRLRRIPLYAEMLAGDSDEDQRPQAEGMLGLLRWLEERGGAEGWLLAHGLRADEIAAFRTDLLVDPA